MFFEVPLHKVNHFFQGKKIILNIIKGFGALMIVASYLLALRFMELGHESIR